MYKTTQQEESRGPITARGLAKATTTAPRRRGGRGRQREEVDAGFRGPRWCWWNRAICQKWKSEVISSLSTVLCVRTTSGDSSFCIIYETWCICHPPCGDRWLNPPCLIPTTTGLCDWPLLLRNIY
nr:PREDICTED: uncharacterized protein LOC108953429 isoform X2 [Musa acuminata subsp. malaccensis]